MSITGGFGELDAAIRWLERVGAADLGIRIAKRAAPALEKVARRQWATGRRPDGSSWPRTKDGRVALLSVTAKIRVTAEGDAVFARGPEELAYHQRERPALPGQGEIPSPWLEALEDATRAEMEAR